MFFLDQNHVHNLTRNPSSPHLQKLPIFCLRKYDDGKTEWTEIEDLKKMDPCLQQHQSGATDLISLGKVFSFPPAEEKTLVEVAEKAGTLTICIDFLED